MITVIIILIIILTTIKILKIKIQNPKKTIII